MTNYEKDAYKHGVKETLKKVAVVVGSGLGMFAAFKIGKGIGIYEANFDIQACILADSEKYVKLATDAAKNLDPETLGVIKSIGRLNLKKFG